MTTRTAAITLDGDGMRFRGRTGSGHAVVLDTVAGDAGPRPAELVPLALAGCTAMDVISILRKKRQSVTRYAVEATGEQQADPPHAFTRIDVVHEVEGPAIDVEAVRRAIELSATKYCSVGATLASALCEIRHSYIVRDASGHEHVAEVIVLGSGSPRAEDEPALAESFR